MPVTQLPKNTPAILRKHGLKVSEVSGWETRGRPRSTGTLNAVGVLCHHTATNSKKRKTAVINILVHGRAGSSGQEGLPGPLCHFGLARDGTVYIVSAGRANHAGVAKNSGTVASGDGNTLYLGIEAMNDGVGEQWGHAQYRAYVLLCAVLSVEFTKNSVQTVRGHKETSVTGKIDPTFNMDKFRSDVEAKMKELKKPTVKKTAKKVVKKAVKKVTKKATPSKSKVFTVLLVPGRKINSAESVRKDMKIALTKVEGHSAILVNTERNTPALQAAVLEGLGKGWRSVFNNENVVAYGVNWRQKVQKPVSTLLAKEDPSKKRVSPNRYGNEVVLDNITLSGHPIATFATHLLSEANCQHLDVFGRAWREKWWPVQLNDCIDRIERLVKLGIPVIFAGDLNTGIHFNGEKVMELLSERFPGKVVHVHNGHLDHIFAISAGKVWLSEEGVETVTNNNSDHDMVAARLKATVLS